MILYTVSVTDADAHLIDVRLVVSSPDPEGQRLRLPDWIPGSYMIRDFSRNIVKIEACAYDVPVPLRKLDKSTWQAPAGLSTLSVSYRVYAWDLSVRAAHVDRTHVFFNGTSVFPAVLGQEEQPHRVRFERPVHDRAERFQLATTLPAVEVAADGYGLYQASCHNKLIDHPVEQVTFKRLSFEACGIPHEIILTGSCHFDEKRVTEDLARICEYQIRFFGEPAPVQRYLFMAMVVDSGYGGLEHRSSTALMISREHLPIPGVEGISDLYLEFLGLCSHEYFHTWNVKRIKPARFMPYALNAESHTELLWFFEGMTSYYDDLVLVRAGLIDARRYLGLLAQTLTRVQRGPGRLLQTVTDSSFDAWHKFYKQDENAQNAIVSYYTKGALIGLCLDALMRSETSGSASLDTLMQKLWDRWLEDGRGIEEDGPQRLAAQIAGVDLSGFFDTVLYSTEELPVETALATLGAGILWRSRTSSTDMGGTDSATADSPDSTRVDVSVESRQRVKPWLGANTAEAPGGVRLVQVLTGGAAEQAGLAAGDVVVAISHLSVNKASVDSILERYSDRQSIPVHYFRLGQLSQSELAIVAAPCDTAELSIVDEQRLSGWLGQDLA